MTGANGEKVHKGSKRKAAESPSFKYYIHDTAAGYVLEMSGPFTQESVYELNCCWETAKTTLRDRKPTLNLAGVTALDEGAKQWLASMAQEGARYVPESFLLESEAGRPGRGTPEPVKRNVFGRLASAIRGNRKTVIQEL
jgi:hypothetical protein